MNNKSNEENGIPKYLLVINPYTGKHMNVLPMFELLTQEWAASAGSLDNFIKPLQDTQDFLATGIQLGDLNHTSFLELGTVNCNIVRLRKMFEAMAAAV